MKVMMELQAIQSKSSRNRGIGRYSQEITKQIIKTMDNKNIDLFLNNLYKEHDKNIQEYFYETMQSKDFIKYDILDLSLKNILQKMKYNPINSFLIKKQINNIEKIDIIHFHSLFEGQVGDKADVVSDFSGIKGKVVVTLYDLIPMLFEDIYLNDDATRHWYYRILRLLYEADLILAISDATKEDAINLLGIPEHKIINISGAIDSSKFFKIKNIDKYEYDKFLKSYNITQPFIMYTGGIDFRKNINLAIKAFSDIETPLLNTHQFVIVCKISKTQKNSFLSLISSLNIPQNKIIFTGFISDEDLNKLYNLAKLFVFPSIYEGFGLPVLEAMSCALPVVASDTSSIPEILDRQDCLFDPKNTKEITEKLTKYLTNKELLKELKLYCYNRSKEFSWNSSALKSIEGYKSLLEQEKVLSKKPKVAFFSPLPNMRSGISDYSLELLPFLSKYADIDIYIDDYTVSSTYLNSNYNIYDYRAFDKVVQTYDNIIYQFGNSRYHAYMYDIALKYPGIIVLHDFYLSGLVNYISTTTRNRDFLFDAIEYSHQDIANRYKDGILSKTISLDDTLKDLPINKKILDSATSIIVHSDYAKKLFSEFYTDQYNITKIEQLIKTPSLKRIQNKSKLKEKLKLKSDEVVICAFGHISDRKQYDFILECLIQANIFHSYNIKLIFVGEYATALYEKKIASYINAHNLHDRVTITGFVDDDIYQEYLIASDIGINLRIDSRGETSRALLMNMAYGLPTIINDYASFAEIPEIAAIKVTLNSKEDFIKNIKELLEDEKYRNKISSNAYQHIVKKHNIGDIAKEYFEIIMKNSHLSKKITQTEEVADIIIAQGLDGKLTDKEYAKIETILRG